MRIEYWMSPRVPSQYSSPQPSTLSVTSSMLVDLAQLDQPAVFTQDRAASGDLQRFGLVGRLDQKVAADGLLRLGVGAIDEDLAVAPTQRAAPALELVAGQVLTGAAQFLGPGDV